MHEKIADVFERIMAIIMIVSIIMIFLVLYSIVGHPAGAIFGTIVVGLPVVITTFGVFSTFISIRRTLMSIDQQLRNRPM